MRPDPQREAVPYRQPMCHALRDKLAMAGSWAHAAHCWELMALWAWLPTFLAFSAQGGRLSVAQGIGLAAAAHLVSVAGSLYGGGASDRSGRTRVMMVASCACLLCSFTFGWMLMAPVWMLATFGALYNLWAIADSSVYSTALAVIGLLMILRFERPTKSCYPATESFEVSSR